ncbi:helix-turn-helix transcriptional regulator [Acinetobacter nematophilus]|uniref:helix-turn-helix transcriptional regulator n=1 Tax=Acinetobacter nematophilus TaxID=2994642 RepID=UPI003AF5AE55
MNNLDQYYDELVDLIYKIPLDADGWQPFLKRLNSILDSSSVHVLAIDLEKDAFSFSNCSGKLSDEQLTVSELKYLHYPVKEDIRMTHFFHPDRKGWYQCHHEITEDMVSKSLLYQKILLPIDMRYTSMQDFLLDEKLCVLIGINTSRKRGIIQQEYLEFMDRLFIHLKRVILLQRKLYEFSTNAIVGFELINKLAQPILLLDLSGQIVHANHAFKKIENYSDLVAIRNNRLILPQPYQSELEQNLNDFETFFKKQRVLGKGDFQDGCIILKSKDGEIVYVFSTLLVSENEMKMFGIRPIVMLTFYHPQFTPNIDLNLLNTAFDLTRAELQVASLLLEGYLPKEIAQKNNVNTDTVRKQLQSIFKKTDTNRQSELIKLLLNMPKYHEKA